MMMKLHRIFFLLGLAVFIAAFFLGAVADSAGLPIRGYLCAYFALAIPLGHDGVSIFQQDRTGYFALLISGFINPVFLVAVFFAWRDRPRRLLWTLRIMLVAMIPFCWVVFHHDHLHPLAAYYMWTAGILAVVYSGVLAHNKKVEHPR